jgi:hypothetical protein
MRASQPNLILVIAIALSSYPYRLDSLYKFYIYVD